MKPKYIHYGLSLLAGAITLISTVSPADAADKKPNIVFILVDNLGYGELGAMGVAYFVARLPRASIHWPRTACVSRT